MSQLDAVVSELTGVTAQIRQSMEQAEAKVEQVNRLIPRLIGTGLLTRSVWLGPRYERGFDNAAGPQDAGQVVQAALILPHGFGVCVWELEEYSRHRDSADGLESFAAQRFHAFARCSVTEKAFLNAAIQPLMEELADVARVAQSRLDEGASVSMEQFFAEGETGGQRGE